MYQAQLEKEWRFILGDCRAKVVHLRHQRDHGNRASDARRPARPPARDRPRAARPDDPDSYAALLEPRSRTPRARRLAHPRGPRRADLHVGHHRDAEGRPMLSHGNIIVERERDPPGLHLRTRRPLALVPAVGALLRPDLRAALPGQHGLFHGDQRRRQEPGAESRRGEADDALRRAARLQPPLRRREHADRREAGRHPVALHARHRDRQPQGDRASPSARSTSCCSGSPTI